MWCPLSDFHKICRICTPFQDALAAKLSLDLLKGLWSYWGFKLMVSGYPQIFSTPYGETVRHTPKSFRGARTCSRASVTVPSLVGARISAAKNVEFFCLFVCSSRFWTSEFVHPISLWRRWNSLNVLNWALIVTDKCTFYLIRYTSKLNVLKVKTYYTR